MIAPSPPHSHDISFYRGFIPCIARSFPANGALLLTVYQLNNMGIPWGH